MGKLTFGPVFIVDGFEKVMNEMPAEKLGKTHRQKAILEAINKIQQIQNK